MREPLTHPVAWPTVCFAREVGALELSVGETVEGAASRPQRVSAILCAMIGEIDGAEATPDLVERLSSGTREWLLQQCGARCRPADDWFETRCNDCGATFDTSFDLAALPRSHPAENFPVVSVELSDGSLTFQLPCGHHEHLMAAGASLPQLLAALCLDDEADQALAALTPSDLETIDIALDAAAPDVADRIALTCPDCGAVSEARIDPLAYAFPGADPLLRDIHRLSRAYHWSEADILALPTKRRHRYVALVGGGGTR